MITLTLILNWIKNHWRLLAYIGAGILVLVLLLQLRSCFKKPIKMDQEQIQKVNSQNEKEVRAGLEKIITDNQDSLKTVNQNNTISEESIENKQKEIDKKVDEAEQKVQEAKQQKGDISQEDLECLLVPEHCTK